MTPSRTNSYANELDEYLVIHPLDDEPELKKDPSKLGPLKLTPTVRISLFMLRGYLILMTVMLLYHLLDIAGVFRR